MEALVRFLAVAPQLQDYLVKTAVDSSAAKELLRSLVNKSAVSIFMALNMLYGWDFVNWEPETLWITLKNDGIDVNDYSRNKIQAAITLQHNPSFFWDNLVFQKTVQAFQEESTDPEALVETDAASMAWVSFEAAVLRRLDSKGNEIPDFDGDVQRFVAVCLRRQGMIVPPVHLDFAEEALDEQWPKESASFKLEVKDAWEHLDKDALEHTEFAEDRLGIQLAKLAGCFLHVRDQSRQMFDEIAQLKSSVTA